MQKLPRLEPRAAGIPTTTVTNQIAETVNAMQATIVTGQDDETRGGARPFPMGEFQHQDYSMVSQNQPGWDGDRTTAILEDG